MGTFVTGNTALPAAKTDKLPPQGFSYEIDAGDVNGLWGAAGDLRTHSTGWLSVREYGATGTADDTAVLQLAINAAQAAGLRLYVPSGTYIVTGLTISGSMRLSGGGTLKLKDATAADLLTITGTSTVVRISGLTFDGNEQNQAVESPNRTINFVAVGTATAPAGIDINHCTFLNGAYTDIRVHTDGTTATAEWTRISNNTFLAGREGTSITYDPRYVDLSSPTDYVVEGNIFDRLAGPTVFGRAGVAAYDGMGTNVEGRGTITGNTFVDVGRSQLNSSLGNIDLYSRARSVVIADNSITNPHGRGINVKAESHSVAITGNTISGLSGGSDGTVSAQIVLNASSTSSEANGPFTIAGNSLIDSGQDGISLTAKDVGGTVYAHGVLVAGNTITNAARRGIGVASASEVSLVDNVVVGCAVGVFIDATVGAIHVTGNQIYSPSGNCINVTNTCATALLNIAKNTTIGGSRGVFIASGAGGSVNGNVITGPATSGMDISGTTGPLRVADNMSDAATPFVNSGTNTALHVTGNDWTMGTTAHTLTIAAGVVLATMDWHYIDTEAAAATDDLDTINGGYDGQILMLRPANAARVVIVRDGTGNLRTSGDFALDSTQDSITLRWGNDAWIEVARSDNATVINAVNVVNGGSFTPSLKAGTEFIIATVAAAAAAFTVNAPIGAATGRPLVVKIKNTSAGALGTATWNAIYKLAAWTQPAAGTSRAITFQWDGTNWVEISRAPADVPN